VWYNILFCWVYSVRASGVVGLRSHSDSRTRRPQVATDQPSASTSRHRRCCGQLLSAVLNCAVRNLGSHIDAQASTPAARLLVALTLTFDLLPSASMYAERLPRAVFLPCLVLIAQVVFLLQHGHADRQRHRCHSAWVIRHVKCIYASLPASITTLTIKAVAASSDWVPKSIGAVDDFGHFRSFTHWK